MRLDRITTCPAAETGRVRLKARISYDTTGLEDEEIWFEYPEEFAAGAAVGDPWLPLLLPAAVVLGEAIQLDRDIDGRLLEGMQSLQLAWVQWFPELRPVAIHAATRPSHPVVPGRRAAFFSGGVDSFFTILRRNRGDAWGAERVDELVTAGGFDVPHDRAGELMALRRRAERVSSALGCSSVFVSTNLRETQFRRAPWDWLSHGCALASLALLFGTRWAEVLIPASAGFLDLHPWGTHPLTDGLFSTRATRFMHDGGNHTRAEKIACIAADPVAAENLRVCWIRETDGNCSVCAKCLRTKAFLSLLGAPEIPAFDWREDDLARIAGILARHPFQRRQLIEIRTLAASVGRNDIVTATDRALRRSKYFMAFDRMARTFAARPVLWRLSSAGDAWVRRRSIG